MVLKCTSGVTLLEEKAWALSRVAAGSPACRTVAVPALQNAISSTLELQLPERRQ